MKILWIGGWGTSSEWGLTAVRRWQPTWNHEWVTPSPTCTTSADGSHDWIGGYSFGAFLMLLWPKQFPSKKGHFFIAPFLDLKREAGFGGKVAATQLRVTRRRLDKYPCAAVNEFYQKSGLQHRLQKTLPYDKEDLAWGLDMLLGESASIPDKNPGPAVLGSEDLLVDAAISRKFFPRIMVVKGAGHRLEELGESLQLS